MNIVKQNLSILCVNLARGGAQKVISLLLKELVKDYNVTLVFFYDHVHFPIPEEVKVIYLNNDLRKRWLNLRFMDSIKFMIKYNRLIKNERISISISFLALPNIINGIVSRLNCSLFTIASERGFPTRNLTSPLSKYTSKILYKTFYNQCDKLFSNSIYINEDLKNNFCIKIPMEVIYNPIEIPTETIIPSDLNDDNTTLKIISAGTLNANKNHIMIFKALKLERNYDSLLLLGDGELKTHLDNEVQKLKLTDRVKIAGSVKDVNKFLLTGNCFVLSSFNEGFPNALLEAMAIGLPCISTNCQSGPLELLNENYDIKIDQGQFAIAKYGILINPNDHIGLSKALKYLRNNPNIREKYSALSLERSKDYLLPKIYTQLHEFLKH